MIKLQEINFPLDCIVVNHDFYNYDPVHKFNEADSQKYLNEDLLQCTFPKDDMIIDLGWYGDIVSNKGEFRINVIKNQNWEYPFQVLYSKSIEEITSILIKILQYYSRLEAED